MELEIKYVAKTNLAQYYHQIEFIGGFDIKTKESWKLHVRDAIKIINNKTCSYYIMSEKTKIPVIIKEVHDGIQLWIQYLGTSDEGPQPNSLLNLPPFPAQNISNK